MPKAAPPSPENASRCSGVSEVFALAAAFCIALSSMFLSELKGRVPLFQLARWQMLAAFVMTGLVSLVLGGWRTVGPLQFWQLAASSVAGIAIASTAYFATIYMLGPRITALLFSLTAPFAVALGYLVIGETITLAQGLGVALVLGGIILAIGLPAEASGKIRLWPGIPIGLLMAFGQAVGSICARPAMASGVEPFTAMALRSGLAGLFFVILSFTPLAASSRQPFQIGAFGLATVSAFLGAGLGMSLLMAALHNGDVGIVSTLSSMTPIVILPMVWIRTGRPPSLAAWLGALLAISGTALISLG